MSPPNSALILAAHGTLSSFGVRILVHHCGLVNIRFQDLTRTPLELVYRSINVALRNVNRGSALKLIDLRLVLVNCVFGNIGVSVNVVEIANASKAEREIGRLVSATSIVVACLAVLLDLATLLQILGSDMTWTNDNESMRFLNKREKPTLLQASQFHSGSK
jgi:cytochrome c biogenesis protein ResB